MSGSFSGKVALVTGAGSGIGRASAQTFAPSRAKVIVANVNLERGEETVRLIKDAGGEATFIQTDVSKAREVEALIQHTVEIYGRLDYALNNAGIMVDETVGTIDFSEEAWDRVLAVNLKGVWLCMKYELPEMLKQGSGVIVNTSSVAGLIGGAGTVAYTASKHGIVGLTKTTALEFAKKGIRVNAVCPGLVRTPMLEHAFATRPDIEARFTALEPVGRIADPEEVVQTVVWLCSDAASFITGVALPVDGGWTAR